MRQNLAVRRRVGKQVRLLRQSRKLSQEQLAELIERTPKHIGEIERGEANVGIDSLAAIAHALTVDVVELLGTPTSAGRRPDLASEEDLALLGRAAQVMQRLSRLKF